MEEKIKRAEVIVIATVGETRYYKWKDLSRAELPEISKIQLDGFDAYVNLADLQILYDKYADIPIGRNPLKINMPLWSQRYGCFAEYGEKEPEPFPNGKKFIFFIGSPSRTSKGTLLETICQHNSAAMDQLSTVHQYIRNIESRTK
ncbi:MAG: hypothetical protein CFE43_21620 [Burkholderiales bacterium PBB3]|nr:MAG: hypothetical protein CFE43_21620 [Burkholderiales bacterium PBB3]